MDGRDNNFGIDFAPIGQAIKKARIAQNMTREQLAGIIEYSIRHVQSIENEGQFPSIQLFIYLVRMFHISLATLNISSSTQSAYLPCCIS